MVNFRFHLVSLIAVFLALGLGILVGSSVVDRVIVNRLDDEIASVRRESAERNAENDRLSDQIAKLNEYVGQNSNLAIQGRLTDVPVALVVEKGVDADAAKMTFNALRSAGAQVPGILWLDDRWRLDKPEEVESLATAVDTEGNAAAVRTEAVELLAARLARPQVAGPRRPPDVMAPLRDAKFVEYTDGNVADLSEFPERAARVVIMTGTNSRIATSETMTALVNALIDAEVPTVVTEVYDDQGSKKPAPVRGQPLAPIRGNAALSDRVSTVDGGEQLQGAVTLVFALDQIGDDVVGHYGYGQGATALMPKKVA